MHKKYLILILAICFTIAYGGAQDTFKVMFYNLLNYPLEDAVPNREDDLEFILSDYQPDLFLVCELNNIAGANAVLGITKTAINTNFEMATYVSNTSDDNVGDQNDLQNLLYYDSSKFSIEEEVVVPTDLRDFNVYRLQPKTVDQSTNPIDVYVIVCHLKASSGPTNAQRRFEMVLELESYLDTLPEDANVVLGGDLNIYTATEAAFQELLDEINDITFVDPPNRIGSWNNNPNFVDVFTQSTRTQSGLGGTRGGFDDRFDFILTSENMLNTANVRYVADSYQVFGNNGLASCYNSAINSGNCGTTDSEFSFEIRDALHNFSDHLPVTLTLEMDAVFLNVEKNTISKKLLLEKTLNKKQLTLLVNSPEYFNQNMVIYNSIGQSVKLLRTNTDRKQTFDVSNLENGLYFLALSNFESVKFIIAN